MAEESYSGPVIRFGETEFWECDGCGAIVLDTNLHHKWHKAYAQVADDAGWGGMLRPLGGGPPF